VRGNFLDKGMGMLKPFSLDRLGAEVRAMSEGRVDRCISPAFENRSYRRRSSLDIY
jgi:hypothetical protein